MVVREYVSLAKFTTMRAGGPARYFFVVQTVEEVKEAVGFAHTQNLPLFVLGKGSNILVSDQGFDGVVIKMEIDGIEFKVIDDSKVRVIAGAGVNWDSLVEKTVEKNLYGLANLSLIPGTVGAAPVQNINAYGAHVSDTVEWVEVFNTQIMRVVRIEKNTCAFKYRSSLFKKNSQLIVLRVSFLLDLHGIINIEYKDIKKYFDRKGVTSPSIADVRNAVVSIRTGKLPNIKNVNTAGSFFIHHIIRSVDAKKLKEKFPDLSFIPIGDEKVKIIIGRLLDKCLGWKNKKIGNVGTHKTHALVIVNYGENNAQEIFSFAKMICDDVKEKTNIDLEFEVNLIGNFQNIK